MTPPAVRHLNARSSDDRDALCLQCGSSIRLSKAEILLLRYYARQQDGFTPAAETICRETGISRDRVFKARIQLEEHGVILVSDGRVLIDWERIRLFSTLDRSMTSKHAVIAPVKKQYYKVIGSQQFYLHLQTCSIETACKILSAVTEEQYSRIREVLRKQYHKVYSSQD